jgi:P4 family phage/plasmid primase-like protien
VRALHFGNDDVGNAERLAHYYGEDFRYVPTWGSFLTWTGTHWKTDTEALSMMGYAKGAAARIREEARALKDEKDEKRKKTLLGWAIQSRSRARLEAAISLVRSEPGVVMDHKILDKNTWLFNCKSGTIDLKTGVLRKHSQKDLLTKISPVKFDANAKAPRWEKFLEQVIPSKEVRDYLQRFIGYCLTGEVSERQFMILFGGGRNGKSLLLKILGYVMGPYCGTMAPGLLMARDTEAHPAEVADLFGLRLAVASETKQGRAFDEEQLKRMTGNDELKARLMRENWWSFWPTHKLLMAVNHKPRVKDVTESFWDRAALVPFIVRIAKEKVDKDLFNKLVAEAAGILAWMVRGCLAWQQRGLEMPAEVRQATDDYREGEDLLGRFLTEVLSFGKGSLTITYSKDGKKVTEEIKFEETNADITRALKSWCARLNLFVPGERIVGERLIAGGAIRAKNVGLEFARGWRGVRILKLNESIVDTSDTSDTSVVPKIREGHKGQVIPIRGTQRPQRPSEISDDRKVSEVSEVSTAEMVDDQKTDSLSSEKSASSVETPLRPPPTHPPKGRRPRGHKRKESA